jgi:Capsular polysaccharide biosynthesis protein
LEFNQLITIIKKRIWFIVCIPLLITLIVTIINIIVTNPVYESSAKIYVTYERNSVNDKLTYEELMTNEKLVKDFTELIKSEIITKEVIREMNVKNMSPVALSNKITVEAINDTSIMIIKVRDVDPIRTKQLTDKICEVFMNKAKVLFQLQNISVIDTAKVPGSPINSNPIRLIILSYILSFFVTYGFFYFFELINETIKTSEDIENILELNVLGTIPLFNIK